MKDKQNLAQTWLIFDLRFFQKPSKWSQQKGVLKLISYFLVIFMILKLSKSNGMLFMRQIMILEIQNNDLELIL